MNQSERVTKIIAREAAKFILREAGHESLITVTHAKSVSNGERVMVFVSVFPIEKTRGALTFLERQREAFSDYLKNNTHMRIPRVDFILDNLEQSLSDVDAK